MGIPIRSVALSTATALEGGGTWLFMIGATVAEKKALLAGRAVNTAVGPGEDPLTNYF